MNYEQAIVLIDNLDKTNYHFLNENEVANILNNLSQMIAGIDQKPQKKEQIVIKKQRMKSKNQELQNHLYMLVKEEFTEKELIEGVFPAKRCYKLTKRKPLNIEKTNKIKENVEKNLI